MASSLEEKDDHQHVADYDASQAPMTTRVRSLELEYVSLLEKRIAELRAQDVWHPVLF